MGIIPRKHENPHDLTEDEVAFLRSSSVPAEVRSYLARQHENIGTKTSAYRKVAAAANAEADALLAVVRLEETQGRCADAAALRAQLGAKDEEIRGLKASNDRMDAEIRRVRSLPASVVHSTD